MASLLIIEHPRTGERYAVRAADFRKSYAERGFKPVRYEDGSAYEPPAPKAERDTAARTGDGRTGDGR